MNDLFGKALLDFYEGTFEPPLLLHNEYGEPEEIPVETYFNTPDEFSDLEHFALSIVKGRILDIGAATGRHAWYLQQRKKTVTALDLSPACGIIMKDSGISNVVIEDVFQFHEGRYDTVIMLMNGIGLVGNIEGLRRFLSHMKTLLKPRGQLIFDSTDISYLYSGITRPFHKYFGQLSFWYEYKSQSDEQFSWLYIDQKKLEEVAEEEGWMCQVVYEDAQDSFLARLTR